MPVPGGAALGPFGILPWAASSLSLASAMHCRRGSARVLSPALRPDGSALPLLGISPVPPSPGVLTLSRAGQWHLLSRLRVAPRWPMAKASEPEVTLPVGTGPKSELVPRHPRAKLSQHEACRDGTILQSRRGLESNSNVPHALHRAYLRTGSWSRSQCLFQQGVVSRCEGRGALGTPPAPLPRPGSRRGTRWARGRVQRPARASACFRDSGRPPAGPWQTQASPASRCR